MERLESQLTRRALLRGGIALGAGAALASVLAACTNGAPRAAATTAPWTRAGAPPGAGAAGSPTDGTGGGRLSIPSELVTVPQGFTAPAQQRGSLVDLQYDTYESTTYEQKSNRLTKRAVVFLPYGYTESRRYDVLYLMHGGGGNETSTLGTSARPAAFKNVLDNAIAAGQVAPLIVVCPTYNNTSPNDSSDFGLALTLNQNYHQELLNDLMPAVERQFSTHADGVSPDDLKAARDHRGFGGFSMGAVATWRTFQFGLDYFRYFLPMSCGTSLDMDNVLAAARTHDPYDYFVWVITGTNDFAHPYDEARVALMRGSSSFVEAGDGRAGNFAYRVKDGYGHDGVAATEYTYNGLLRFWPA